MTSAPATPRTACAPIRPKPMAARATTATLAPATTRVSGGPTNCNDSNQCTDDSCNPATGCAHAAVQNGLACGDANVCNGIETCQAGVCTPGTPLNCDNGNNCT